MRYAIRQPLRAAAMPLSYDDIAISATRQLIFHAVTATR